MTHVEIKSRVCADDVLLDFPSSRAGRGQSRSQGHRGADNPFAATPNRGNWREFVKSMAGCISDPTFQRPEQGQYEQRTEAFRDLDAGYQRLR